MNITSDLVIKDIRWRKLTDLIVNKYKIIETAVELFIICAAIGVADGKKEESVVTEDEEFIPLNLPKQVLSYDKNKENISFLYQSYVFSFESKLTTEEKIKMAFLDDEGSGMKKIEHLRLCANYGMRLITETITNINDEYLIMEEVLSLLKEKTEDLDSILDCLLN